MTALMIFQVFFIAAVGALALIWPRRESFFIWAMGFGFGFTLCSLLTQIARAAQ
jgi:hypothetical protein